MEILSAEQIKKVDDYTILNLPIKSIDLMEKASGECVKWIIQNIDKKRIVYIFCGPGNNGGDGLAIARLLKSSDYPVRVFLFDTSGALSTDCNVNLERLVSIDKQSISKLSNISDLPEFEEGAIIIDALFGSGLTRNLDGELGKLVRKINQTGLPVISIDLPSGIYSDKTSLNSGNEIIKASVTLTFQYLKPALLVAENAPYFGRIVILNIGLLPQSTQSMEVLFHLIDHVMVKSMHVPKKPFAYKNNFGHALLMAGSNGKMGAAVLAAKGFLKSGGGLLTVLIPESGVKIVQTAVPEAMVEFYDDSKHFSDTKSQSQHNVYAAGPGIGTGDVAKAILDYLIAETDKPMVLDADALNILAEKPEWLKRLPVSTILTPHIGEFKRLAGNWENDFDKLKLQRQFASNHKVYLILKGKNTSIACPDGKIYFNSTGNPGMAKGGSGDILTGLIAGILASGYPPFQACVTGVYLHGLAGDIAAQELTEEGMNAGDIINCLPQAWKSVVSRL